MLKYIRDRYHPLFHLRRSPSFRWLTSALDLAVPKTIEGISFPVYISLTKNATLLVSGGRLWEEDERQSFLRLVDDNRIRMFWDVGANIGIYAFLFLSRVPDGKAILFEPDARNARLIARTVRRNNLRNVVQIAKAASDRDGVQLFYPDAVTGASGSLVPGTDEMFFVERHHHVDVAPVEVSVVRIDTVSRSHGAPQMLKIDVEGAELSVLRGATETLRVHKPVVFFEASRDHDPIRKLLTEAGYAIYDMTTLRRTDALAHNNVALHPEKHVLY